MYLQVQRYPSHLVALSAGSGLGLTSCTVKPLRAWLDVRICALQVLTACLKSFAHGEQSHSYRNAAAWVHSAQCMALHGLYTHSIAEC